MPLLTLVAEVVVTDVDVVLVVHVAVLLVALCPGKTFLWKSRKPRSKNDKQTRNFNSMPLEKQRL